VPDSLQINARKLSSPAWRHRWPLTVLETTDEMTRTIEAVRVDAVRDARALGMTWDQIGEAMGTTRQGAYNFARRWLDQRLPLD